LHLDEKKLQQSNVEYPPVIGAKEPTKLRTSHLRAPVAGGTNKP